MIGRQLESRVQNGRLNVQSVIKSTLTKKALTAMTANQWPRLFLLQPPPGSDCKGYCVLYSLTPLPQQQQQQQQ